MKKLIFAFMLMGLSPLAFAQAKEPAVVSVDLVVLRAPQMTVGIEQTECGQVLGRAQATGNTVYLANVFAIPVLDNPLYEEYKIAGESCFRLVTNGSNDYAWAMGALRAPGCICGNVSR